MIAVDTNILVYAHRREVSHHAEALDTLRRLAEGNDRWAIPWPCLYEFFSVVTNARIWKDVASTPVAAWKQIQAWTSSPTISLLSETDGFLDILSDLVQRPKVRGPIVHDARIAAICIAHGIETLLTRDRDFALFPELPTRDPVSSRRT